MLWSEGVFLQPHHFQQHDRYLKQLVGAASAVATPYPWGVQRLTVDTELLDLGKMALVEAKGLLPDGTPFNLPADGPPPPALELDETVKEQVVYLALPLRQPGLVEAGGADATDATLRYRSHIQEVRDNHTGPQQTEAPVEVGTLELRLLLERDDRNGFAHTGLVRVLECRADQRIVLDDAYIPPCVDCKASPRLAGFVGELLGLLHHRGETLAARVSGSGRSGVAEWADFLLLQVINRLEPLTAHLDAIAGLHPELLYRLLLPMAGELATFTAQKKRPPEFPTYRHDDLAGTFTPVMVALREALSRVLAERAIPIPIQERKFGFRVAPLSNRTLLAAAGQLRNSTTHPDPRGLHNRLVSEVRTFEECARAKGIPENNLLTARYVLCSLLNETVLGTPWGSESIWAEQGLLIGFHKETWGGEKFFLALERLMTRPSVNLDLLELMYLCLAFGFRGRYARAGVGTRPTPPPIPARPLSLRILLADQIAAGRMEVVDGPRGRTETVVIQSDHLFLSGCASLNKQFLSLLGVIGEALKQLPGEVLVTGHTDGIPIRTLKFPSNQVLSAQRARNVTERLRNITGQPDRFTAKGLVDSRPRLPEDPTHARNRRVEISLRYPARTD